MTDSFEQFEQWLANQLYRAMQYYAAIPSSASKARLTTLDKVVAQWMRQTQSIRIATLLEECHLNKEEDER